MATRKAEEMKARLLAERDALLRQREALDNQIAGLERAIQLVSAEETSAPRLGVSGKRTPTKNTLLDLLEEVGTLGLNASMAVALANKRGVTLDRGSVSSLLSRLKADNVVVYDGDRYRLTKFSRRDGDPNVHDIFDAKRA